MTDTIMTNCVALDKNMSYHIVISNITWEDNNPRLPKNLVVLVDEETYRLSSPSNIIASDITMETIIEKLSRKYGSVIARANGRQWR